MNLRQTLIGKLAVGVSIAICVATLAASGYSQAQKHPRPIPLPKDAKADAANSPSAPTAGPAFPFRETALPSSTVAGVTPGPDGLLYGVTYEGGTFNKGTIYRTDPNLNIVTVLYSFDDTIHGSIPYEELIFDPATSKFYGTTSKGGPSGVGTVFAFDPATNALTTLASDFGGYYQPQGLYVSSGNFIYGIAARSNGAIFRIAKDGSGFTIIHAFADFSSLPQALTLGADGKLYGVTIYGGADCAPGSYPGCGTIFRLDPVLPGNTNEQFQTLYQFNNAVGGQNFPTGRLVYGSDGLVYGSSVNRLFRLDPQNATPGTTMQFIYATAGTVSMAITEGSDNRLYVASYSDNVTGAGRIFSIKKDGSDFLSLHDFSFAAGPSGNGPYGRPYRDGAGVVYGTTEYSNASPYPGTVFSISTAAATPKLNVTGGNVLIASPGNGIILRTPTTAVCKLLSIDNSGAVVLSTVTCP